MKSKPILQSTVLSLFTLLSACGGGGSGSPSAGSTTSPASASGTVQGFGSVLVNGCRWSTIGATVTDDTGVALGNTDLNLGMQVQLNGQANAEGTECSASSVEVIREFAGPVSAVGTGTFTVLGHTVLTDTTTVFKGFSGAVVTNDFVEVYGLRKSDGSYQASLVVKKAPSTSVQARGIISALDTSAKTFQIDMLVVNYSAVSTVPTGLVNGVVLKAMGSLSGTTLQATQLVLKPRAQQYANGAVELKGYVQDDAGDNNAATFTVNGVTVDVSNARFEGITGMAVGQFVEVKGQLNGSTLLASKVETEQVRKNQRGGAYEFYGVATNGQLSGNVLTFTVQGQPASYTNSAGSSDVCGISGGTTPYIEVKGDLNNGLLVARKVECPSSQSSQSKGGEYAGNRFEARGTVSNVQSSTNTFDLDGLAVDYSNARFENGAASSLNTGARVEVKGAMDANQRVLIAEKIEFDDSRDQ